MAKKLDYFELLGDSLKIFKHTELLIPILLFVAAGFVMNLFYIPSLSSVFQGVFDLRFLIYVPIIFIVSVIFYAWWYLEIKNVVYGKKVKLFKTFEDSFHLIWRLIGLYIVLFLLTVGIVLIFVLLFGLAFVISQASLAAAIILGIIFGIAAAVVVVVFASGVMYAPIILVTEEKTVVEALKKTYNFTKKNKGHCVIMLLLFGVVSSVISVIGQLIMYLFYPAAELQFLIVDNPTLYVLIALPASIIAAFGFFWLITFYFKTCKIKK
ncbi:hypothetical protein KY328_05980 [Candidatus Woesearchaeota archaeon]|nr:hypothetical protein [Candidatus Woesearchaeota archaeon]